MKHGKNSDTLLLLQFLAKSQREKVLEEHSLWVQVLKKGDKQRFLGILYTQYLPNPKNKFPVKIIFT